jgi:hypothetical protein
MFHVSTCERISTKTVHNLDKGPHKGQSVLSEAEKNFKYRPGAPQIISLPRATACPGAEPSTRPRGYMLRHIPTITMRVWSLRRLQLQHPMTFLVTVLTTSLPVATTQRSRGKRSPRNVLYLFHTNRKVRVSKVHPRRGHEGPEGE